MSFTKQSFFSPQTSAFRKQTFTLDYLNLEKCKCFLWKKYLLLQQKLGFPFKQDHMITRLYFTFRRNLHTPHWHPVIHLAFPFTSACCVNKVELWLSLGTQGDNQCSCICQIYSTRFSTYIQVHKTLFWKSRSEKDWIDRAWKSNLGVFRSFFVNSVLQSTNFSFGRWISLKQSPCF